MAFLKSLLFPVQVFCFPGFESNVLVNKSKEKNPGKNPPPYVFFLYFIIERNNAVVLKYMILNSRSIRAVYHFAAGQEGSALRFSLFDIVNPLRK